MRLHIVLIMITALGMTGPVAADTLELRVVGDGDSTFELAGGIVNVFIQGRIQNPTDFGLALWSANLSETLTVNSDVSGALLDSPGGDIDQFKKNLGLTNPSGYGGTPVGRELIQVGGAQNTIGNTGPTVFPVGTVVTGIANGGGWVNLASGTIDGSIQTTCAVNLQLNTGFASTLATDVGPFFAVNPASVVIVGDGLTLVTGAPCFELNFQSVVSTASHDANGSFAGGMLDIPIDASDGAAKSDIIEPRQSWGVSGSPLAIRVDFDEAIASGSVVSNPALDSLTATPNGNSLDITFDAPVNGTCYAFDITGTTAVSGSTVGEGFIGDDTDFCVCYFEGDINFDSTVDFFDRGAVAFPQNFGKDLSDSGIDGPQVDLNRDGVIDFFDRGVVAFPQNFGMDYSAVGCP